MRRSLSLKKIEVRLSKLPNLSVVNGFVKCFSDSYKYACDRYSGLFEDGDTTDR